MVYGLNEIATFEIPYSEKESAFPYIETIADMMGYLSTEESLDKVNIYRSRSEREVFRDELKEIVVSYPVTENSDIDQISDNMETKSYSCSEHFYFDRHDITNLSKECKNMIKDGVTNPENNYAEPIMFYGIRSSFEGPISSFDLTLNRNEAAVHLEAKDNALEVTLYGWPTQLNDDHVNLFVETLSYAHHKGVPITFNHSGIEKMSTEHEKSIHTQFKSFKFSQLEKVDNLIDSVCSFLSGLFKKGKN